MDRRTTAPAALALALGLALGPAACSDSDGSEVEIPQRDFETGSLDSLAPDEPPAPAPIEDDAPAVIDQSAPAAEPTEDEREWERERQSQTNFGRTRDRVKTLTNRMQDGTEAEDGLAATTPDEEWVGTGGVVWDMPADWRMAIPAPGRFGQMLVPSPLGAASVAFTRETAPVAEIERRTGSMLVTMTGGRISPRTQNFELLGRSVRTLSMEGTLIDPSAKGGSGETPYQAARAAIIDLGDARVLILMWGPEDTVTNNEAKFEAMVRNMSER
jgi:hypothetical protein